MPPYRRSASVCNDAPVPPDAERRTTIWDVNPGYYTTRTEDILARSNVAVWRPWSRLSVWRLFFTTYGMSYTFMLVFAVVSASDGDWVVAVPALGAVMLAVAAEVHFVGRRRVLFTSTSVGISRGPAADLVDYRKITRIGVGLASPVRNPWLAGRTATLVIERGDGIEPYLPRLFTWAPRDWETLGEFVAQQAAEHGLPLD